MFEDVLALHERFTVWVGAGVPVPVNVSVVVLGCALLVNVSVALAVAAVCGLNVTENDVLCPAGIVMGSDKPPTLNAELLVLAPVTVTFAPLAERVPFAFPLVPTTTFPIASVPGDALNWPIAAAPVAVKGMLKFGFEAFDERVTLPLAPPADLGANTTLKLVLWPELRVRGGEIPFRLNPDPLIPA